MSTEPLSSLYLTDERNSWWNRDFLRLMASRLRLSEVRCALDVGCGLGHWTRALAGVLHEDCAFVGVDRESEWVGQARTMYDAVNGRIEYQQSDAQTENLR